MGATDQLDKKITEIFSEVFRENKGDVKRGLLRDVLLDTQFALEEIINNCSIESDSEKLNEYIIQNIVSVLQTIPAEEYRTKYKKEKLEESITGIQDFYDISDAQVLKTIDEKPNLAEITFISVGCGSGKDEQRLEGKIKTKFPNLRTTWFGMDSGNYLDPGSVIARRGRFVLCTGWVNNYIDLFEAMGNPHVWILCNFAAHHMLISPKNFLNKCRGAKEVLVVEELVNKQDYVDIYYRIVKVGNDIVSNFLKSPGWANDFLQNPSIFKIDYWTFESAKRLFKIWNFPSPNSRTQFLSKSY